MNILIIDRNPRRHKLFQRGYPAKNASCLKEAIEAIDSQNFDLIFVDASIGEAIAEHLSQSSFTGKVVVRSIQKSDSKSIMELLEMSGINSEWDRG